MEVKSSNIKVLTTIDIHISLTENDIKELREQVNTVLNLTDMKQTNHKLYCMLQEIQSQILKQTYGSK